MALGQALQELWPLIVLFTGAIGALFVALQKAYADRTKDLTAERDYWRAAAFAALGLTETTVQEVIPKISRHAARGGPRPGLRRRDERAEEP